MSNPSHGPAGPRPGHLVVLPLKSPPTLLEAVGYHGEAQYVALYWTPYGDELMLYDGVVSRDGNWQAWLTFTDHRLTRAVLAGYQLGSSEAEAEHWLVVDRATGQMSVGLPDDVTRLLRSQPNMLHLLTDDMTSDEVSALFNHVDATRAALRPTTEQVLSLMSQARAAEAAMTAWLDEVLQQVMQVQRTAERVNELARDIHGPAGQPAPEQATGPEDPQVAPDTAGHPEGERDID